MGSSASTPVYSKKIDGVAATSNTGSMYFLPKKKSEYSMFCILNDPVTYASFNHFLCKQLQEDKLNFWRDTKHLVEFNIADTDNYSLEAKIQKAQSIYNKYIQPKQNVLAIDQPTLKEIAIDLRINKDGQITTCDPDIIDKVYSLAQNKVFQQLKFEYMPVFLGSNAFHDVGGTKDGKTMSGDILKELDLEYCLSSPAACHYFKRFLDTEKGEKGLRFSDLLECLLEIQHFRQTTEHRRRRCDRILMRFSAIIDCNMCETISKSVSNLDKNTQLPIELFDEIYKSISAEINNEVFAEFVDSASFKALNNSKLLNEKNKIQDLKNYAEERRLSEEIKLQKSAIDDVTLEALLKDEVGVFCFKRFCRKCFEEENILFYLEVISFQEGEYKTPKNGSVLVYDLSGGEIDFMQLRANRIMEKYIKNDSKLQINISNDLRNEIIDGVMNHVHQNVFDRAHREVFNMLHHNLWHRFKQKDCSFWQSYVSKKRDAIRLANYANSDIYYKSKSNQKKRFSIKGMLSSSSASQLPE